MTAPIIVGISGASGAVYGVEILRALKEMGQPAHLILSEWAVQTLELETDFDLDEVKSLADAVHSNQEMAAAVSSGSFKTRGMIIAPCSVKTLSGIANSFTCNLLIRAADVTLKERRPLVLVFRETPLHKGTPGPSQPGRRHGRDHPAADAGLLHAAQSINDIVRHTVVKVLDQFGLEVPSAERWNGR